MGVLNLECPLGYFVLITYTYSKSNQILASPKLNHKIIHSPMISYKYQVHTRQYCFYPPTDRACNSLKVKIYHVSQNNCGCGVNPSPMKRVPNVAPEFSLQKPFSFLEVDQATSMEQHEYTHSTLLTALFVQHGSSISFSHLPLLLWSCRQTFVGQKTNDQATDENGRTHYT